MPSVFLTFFNTHIVEEYRSTSILIKDAIDLGVEKKLGKVFKKKRRSRIGVKRSDSKKKLDARL